MDARKLIVSFGAAVLLLGACGGSSDGTATDTVQATASAGFDDDDVMFAQMMIPHHEQAIELSDIALDPTVGASEDVRRLATAIKAAQDPEIAEMKALLSGWGVSTEMDPDMDHSEMMDGMLTTGELESLSQLRGAAFDRAWMEAMIKHHEGAVSMAQDVLADGVNTEMRALATAIESAQTGEIAEMRALLG
jgi:uncharacterized protein (DUF305 family)